MENELAPSAEKFGAVLGVAPGGVPVYSSDYATADDRELPNRHAYRSYVDGIYMGYKWQCVEFARRWLYMNKGWIFDDVAMAYDIFRLRTARAVRGKQALPLRSFANGSKRWPEPGCLLIWGASGPFEDTGHVAIVTEASQAFIRFAEQNVEHRRWPEGRDWARELHTQATEDGEYWIECSFGDAELLGWVIQTGDDTYAEEPAEIDRALFNLEAREVGPPPGPQRSWLNVANEDEAAYVAMMGGHRLASDDADQYRYYVLSESAHAELVRATSQLHALFMHATDYVLEDDRLLARFDLPRALWPKIRQSWDNRRNQMITGRLDFSLSEHGLKVYEYNCDSASCLMECGKVQGKWADHFGCEDGRDPGEGLHREIRDAWKNSDVKGPVHIMQDLDLEETYHALFMKDALRGAGFRPKVIRGVEGLSRSEDGSILDADGERIRWVWKTWAWESVLDQIRAECEDDAEERREGSPRLSDVLLCKDVMVYEPLWTLIPSNKAVLPVLWALFPNHRHLLNASFELTDDLRERGYVAKPIVGRCGSNIRIFDADDSLIEETAGAFDNRNQVYQELFLLPFVGGYNVQVSTFSAAGLWAGTCLRVDSSLIISQKSDNLALRVVPDHELGSFGR
jgi:glutathionylspermidine amidase/synthetase